NLWKTTDLSPQVAWPPKLKTLKIKGGPAEILIPTLPLTVTSIEWTMASLSHLPAIAPQWQVIDLSFNSVRNLVNADLSNVTYLSLDQNFLGKIENVTFSPKLKYFKCSGSLATLTLSKSSFDAFNKLQKIFNETSADIGFRVGDNFASNIDTSSCTRANGVVLPLWAKYTNFSACVVSDAAAPVPAVATTTVTPTTSTNAPSSEVQSSSNVGAIVGGSIAAVAALVALASFCLWKRRQQEAKTSDYYDTTTTPMHKDGYNITGDKSLSKDPEIAGYVNLEPLRLLRLVPTELVVT
ncbi:hypothetical protein ACHHYP_00055, partial [Achlya hypogyna]